jgi:hypothetical protein
VVETNKLIQVNNLMPKKIMLLTARVATIDRMACRRDTSVIAVIITTARDF